MLELALLRVLYEASQWPLPIATAVAAEVLILAKFLAADRWVFGHPWPNCSRLVRYHGASAGALVVYWLVINALAESSACRTWWPSSSARRLRSPGAW